MAATQYNLEIIVLILAVAFAYAAILGYFAHKFNLSTILGYLFAGYMIGPYSPGLVVDSYIAEQLAEIGVILMMFGVGLHFKWEDLVHTKNISLPGAIFQTTLATSAGAGLLYALGMPIEMGIVYGFALGVASTVVMVRILTDIKMIATREGHVSMGWLIVEDIITVVMLILLPLLKNSLEGNVVSLWGLAYAFGLLSLKIGVLIVVMFTVGKQIVSFSVKRMAETKSHELFTLVVLALTFSIATGASVIFGVSMAMGAFIAGMVLGQTKEHRRVEFNAMPMRDAFVVIFFISVGMIFNPEAIVKNPLLFAGSLAIILLLKPVSAYLIAIALRQPFRTALVVALALAQIGEFSFILAEAGIKLGLVNDDMYDIIVACAIITISLNPFLFKWSKLEPVH